MYYLTILQPPCLPISAHSRLPALPSDLNRLVMDYLVLEGYQAAAEEFSKEANVSPPVDFSSIETRMTIREAVQRGDVEEAIELVNDLNPEVRNTLLTPDHQSSPIERRAYNSQPVSRTNRVLALNYQRSCLSSISGTMCRLNRATPLSVYVHDVDIKRLNTSCTTLRLPLGESLMTAQIQKSFSLQYDSPLRSSQFRIVPGN